jgi:hypothetical protein
MRPFLAIVTPKVVVETSNLTRPSGAALARRAGARYRAGATPIRS